MMHHQKKSRKKVPRILSSESESSDKEEPVKKCRKKKVVPLISSDESDTAIKDDDSNEQKHSDSNPKADYHDSDNSSVESMNIIMYPSTSVLLEIENSKKSNKIAESKDRDKNNSRDKSQKRSVKEITKSKIFEKQPKTEKTISKSSKEFSKKDKIFSQHKHKKEIQSNKEVVTKVKNKNFTMHRMNNKNILDHKSSNHHEPERELHNNKLVVSKVKDKNSNLFLKCNSSTIVSDTKISNDNKPRKKFQNNEVKITKVNNVKENPIPHGVNTKNVPKGKTSNQHQHKKEIQKNKVNISEDKNKIESRINGKNVLEDKISNKHQPKKELQNNNEIICGVKNKNDQPFVSSVNNENTLNQNYSAPNKGKLANYKIPLLSSSKSDKNKSLPINCNENDKVTCDSSQKEKSESQIQQSTVKKRPDNYGSRLKPLLSDLKSSVENKNSLSKHKKVTEIKSINQLKGNELKKRSGENKMYNQNATHPLGSSNDLQQCTIHQDSTVRNVEHTSTESQPCNSSRFIENTHRNSVKMYRSLIGDDYQHKLIKRIVDIDIKCLEEREKNSILPELSKGAELLPLSFKSFDRYFCKHEPMLILEIWEKIFEYNQNNLSLTNKNYFCFCVKDYKYLNSLMLLDCECEVTEQRPCVLSKSNLVIVKLKQKNDLWSTTFGFIYEIESTENIEYFKEMDEYPLLKSNCKTPAKQFFKMFVKNLEMVALKCLMEGKVICSLYREMKEIEGLYLMKSSPLLYDFLNPRFDTFSLPYDEELCMKDFDTVRQHISQIVCDEVLSSPSKPKIMLLQGPPGSCKTMCIANIAWELSKCQDKKKILIVAPNNLVLEEITAQLLNLNSIFKEDHIKYWCLGLGEIPGFYETMFKEASVILTRPKDCCELEPFKNILQFSCCLIDEINQFTELGILYPFSLDIQKFLLVGDLNQLPPKLRSNITIGFGYQKSVMERFQTFFNKTLDKNPTIILKQQFRMHHEIASFPFSSIYFNHSIICTYASKRSVNHPLRRCVLFDYQCDTDTTELPYTETTGIKFITSLLTHISHNLDSSAIGIIVPTKEVQGRYQSLKKDFPNVEVGTVKLFQGREKPVVIISCFHDMEKKIPSNTILSNEKRLNVALTRATSSLIICGPFHLLMKYDIWAAIVSYSVKHGCYYKIRSEKDLKHSHIEKM